MGLMKASLRCRPLGGKGAYEMMELALIVGGAAIIVLSLLELYLTEDESESPRWLGCVSGPYVMTKRIRRKERDY